MDLWTFYSPYATQRQVIVCLQMVLHRGVLVLLLCVCMSGGYTELLLECYFATCTLLKGNSARKQGNPCSKVALDQESSSRPGDEESSSRSLTGRSESPLKPSLVGSLHLFIYQDRHPCFLCSQQECRITGGAGCRYLGNEKVVQAALCYPSLTYYILITYTYAARVYLN